VQRQLLGAGRPGAQRNLGAWLDLDWNPWGDRNGRSALLWLAQYIFRSDQIARSCPEESNTRMKTIRFWGLVPRLK
jgi:hypothetical protein